MNIIRLFIIFFLFFFAGMSLSTPVAEEVFSKIKPHVYQIVTALDIDSPKASYGTGGVVAENGLIVTNYHVVSQAVLKPHIYQVYAKIGQEKIPAKVLVTDTVNDLAVIKVKRKFDSLIPLAGSLPTQGDSIFSIGLPEDLNMSIVEGTYNEVIKASRYERIHLSSGINSGMSGGPTVNSRGEIVGLNVSTIWGSNNISFAVPLSKVREVIDKAKARKPLSFDPDHITLIGEQLTSVQNTLVEDLVLAGNSQKEFHGALLASVPSYLKCWSNASNKDIKKIKEIRQTCRLEGSSYVERGVESGTYTISYASLHNKSLNGIQFFSYVSSEFAQMGYGLDLYYTKEKKPKHSAPFCENLRAASKNGHPLHVRMCLNKFSRFSDLFDVFLTVGLIHHPKKATLVNYRFQGISRSNFKRLARTIIEKLEAKDV